VTDAALARALAAAAELEAAARAHWQAQREDPPESDAALVIVRLVTPLRRSLVDWTTMRALRAARSHTV
jgi:hypothetical protein